MTSCPTPQGRAAGGAPQNAAHTTARSHPDHPGRHPLYAGLLAALLLGAIVLGATACGRETATADDGSGTLTVFASAVLTEAFTELGEDFAAEHPDVEVILNFSGAGELVAQMRQGADVDVLATADASFMEEAGDIVWASQAFAANTLAIAVPPGNPEGITGLADLGRNRI